MKYKLLTFAIISLFLVSLVLAVVPILTNTTPDTITPSDYSTTFTITPNIASDITVQNGTVILEDADNNQASFSLSPTSATNVDSATTFTVTLDTASLTDDFLFGFYENKVNFVFDVVNATNSTEATTHTVPVSFEKSYCEAGDNAQFLEVKKVKFINDQGFGNDDEWYMFDEIEVEITIENTGADDIDDVVVEWGLYNSETGEFVIGEEEESEFNLDEDEEEKLTVSFMVDPEDFDEDAGQDDFVFYVKAYSEDTGFGEENECISEAEKDIKIMRDDNFVIAGNFQVPDTAECGELVEVSGEVWNVGDDDEEDVYVIATNTELGINHKIEIGDMDVWDDAKFSFDVKLPENTEERTYSIEFIVYDDGDDPFENDDNDEAEFATDLTVSGACKLSESVEINDDNVLLDSDEVIAGQEFVIKATLKNTGDGDSTYKVVVGDYSSWASLEDISPETFTLASGQSKEVTITFIADKDASGDNDFTLQAVFGGELSDEKTIVVPVEPSKGFLKGITGFSVGGEGKTNWLVWLIILLNVILVLVIIMVVVRLVRRKSE